MKFESLSTAIEKYILPLANKLSSQRHLRAIRDAFMSILPITLLGGVIAVLGAAPITETTTNGFLLAWANFAQANSMLIAWVNALTLGGMSLYICIGVTYFLSKHFKLDVFIPLTLSVFGFLFLVLDPIEIGFAGKTAEISFMDGRGILPAIIIAIFTVEFYNYMRTHNWGRINLPPSVPASLIEVFAGLVPAVLVLLFDVILWVIFYTMGTTFPGFIYTIISPTLNAVDSLGFTILITLLVHIFWFFGIHDAALAGILGPIRDGNLSINATAQAAGQALPHVFTTPFWVYFVIIGGCGSVLALAIILCFSKSKQLKTVGRVGLLPAFFGISEPIIFGVPLMLNPIYLIPFLLTSTINGAVSYILMEANIIGRSFAMLSWQMPSIFGAFLSTMDIKAMLLVFVLIIVDGIVYYPFFKANEKQCLEMEKEEQ